MELLKALGDKLNVKTTYLGDLTLLHLAAFNNMKETALYLISKGAGVNAVTPKGETPLMIVFRSYKLPGNADAIADALIANGADKKKRGSDGYLAHDYAMNVGASREVLEKIWVEGAHYEGD